MPSTTAGRSPRIPERPIRFATLECRSGAATIARVDSAALEHYLDDDSRFGEPLPGAFRGSAGGAACGDLIAISLRLDSGCVADVRQSGTGCAAARAAAAAVAELADGAGLRDAALIDAAAVSTELGGLSPVGAHAADLAAEALHRALGVAVARCAEPILDPPAGGEPERVLVAVSGGVDSAVAALREQEGGAEVFAITLELWSDPANDGERSCCSADAVRVGALRRSRPGHSPPDRRSA